MKAALLFGVRSRAGLTQLGLSLRRRRGARLIGKEIWIQPGSQGGRGRRFHLEDAQSRGRGYRRFVPQGPFCQAGTQPLGSHQLTGKLNQLGRKGDGGGDQRFGQQVRAGEVCRLRRAGLRGLALVHRGARGQWLMVRQRDLACPGLGRSSSLVPAGLGKAEQQVLRRVVNSKGGMCGFRRGRGCCG
jgi:hypothetical protein